jgi:outer membrane murein-binding lipoprotein Lpp
MKRFTGLFTILFLFLSVSLMAGCEGRVKKEEYDAIKAQVEQLTKDKSDLEKKVGELTNQINTLTAENEQLKSQLAALAQPTPAPGEETQATPAPEGETQTPGEIAPEATPGEEEPAD